MLKHLGTMVKSGKATETEAARIRAAVGPHEFDDAVTAIRVRHASSSLNAAVDNGQMAREEADAYLERVKKGEHPKVCVRTCASSFQRTPDSTAWPGAIIRNPQWV
jgi:hypothetical protein